MVRTRKPAQRPEALRITDRRRWTPADILDQRPELRVYLHDREITFAATIDPSASTQSRVMLRYSIPFGRDAMPGCRVVTMGSLLDAIVTRRPIKV